MVTRSCNPSTWEVETGGQRPQDPPLPHHKFKADLGSVRSCLKLREKREKKKERKQNKTQNLKPVITNLFSHWLRKQRELKSGGLMVKEANKSKRGTGRWGGFRCLKTCRSGPGAMASKGPGLGEPVALQAKGVYLCRTVWLQTGLTVMTNGGLATACRKPKLRQLYLKPCWKWKQGSFLLAFAGPEWRRN